MATVGGVACDICRGEAAHPRQKIVTWEVPGIDNHGARKEGLRGSWEFTAIEFGTVSELNAWMPQIEALQGEVISITDDFGYTHNKLLVVEVSRPKRTALIGDYEGRVEFTLRGIFTR